MPVTGVVVLAHGSRGERGKDDVAALFRGAAAGLKPWLGPDTEITGAALQFNHPDLKEAVGRLAAKGVNHIVIAPYFLFSGRHLTEHVPGLIQELKSEYPGIQFTLTANLGPDDSLMSLLAKRIRRAVPDLRPTAVAGPPPEIERASMKIVSGLLPALPNLSEEELAVVKRIVHACGDPGVACLIRFSPSAMSAGVAALAQGSAVLTDVRMVASGISRRLAGGLGDPVSCALDELGTEEAPSMTRAAQAMYGLDRRLDRAVVVIGNAPTALLALLNMIDSGDVMPALVVGMPVGFVQAAESKAALMTRDTPFITIEGTRGGSAMAAATVNALLRMAADRCRCPIVDKEKAAVLDAE